MFSVYFLESLGFLTLFALLCSSVPVACRGEILPGVKVSDGLQGLGALEQLVEDADDVREAGSLGAVVLPALQHQLVHCRRAVHGCWQTEGLIYGFHHLRNKQTNN